MSLRARDKGSARRSAMSETLRRGDTPRASLNPTSVLVDEIALEGRRVVGEVDGDRSVDTLGDGARRGVKHLRHGRSTNDHLAARTL